MLRLVGKFGIWASVAWIVFIDLGFSTHQHSWSWAELTLLFVLVSVSVALVATKNVS